MADKITRAKALRTILRALATTARNDFDLGAGYLFDSDPDAEPLSDEEMKICKAAAHEVGDRLDRAADRFGKSRNLGRARRR